MTTTQDLIAQEKKYMANNYKPLDVMCTRGEGVWLYDIEGKRYLDCLSAYSAVNQGHAHPDITRTMVEQAQTLALTSRAFRNDQLGPFAQAVCEATGYEMMLPMNTGAEAVETAIKAARKWGYKVKGIEADKAEIITCDGNFHGRTTTIISFSTEDQYKDGFGPFTPGFVSIPFGDAKALEAAITPNTAAFLVEPLQGENGVVVPPDGYLKAVREICDKHNVLFVADEIQTGLGRTGKLLATDHEGVRADMVILGKALSGGMYPVSAVAASKEILGVFNPGDHGSTYGGNPIGAAVGVAALKALKEENMVENAAAMGEYFQERLAEIPSKHVDHVRGKGLLIGVVLKPDAGGARRFAEALQANGILAKETHDHILRFAPPLIIDKETIDWALDHIAAALQMD